MKAAQLRQSFITFFEKKGHTVVESSSLIPVNDPTLLFTNAGMVQFKEVFLGKEKRNYTRAVSTQKCVRAGGKHNDLENVGFTARHHTFFEMLGNFSFGDYFKKEAIAYAWEFVTKELQIPKEKLYVTVFESDDEAAELWHRDQAIPKERIFRFGEKDNFWAMGETGPCGPCSEIFFDRGETYGNLLPREGIEAGSDRYMEIWNLVFMQYDRDAQGKLVDLPRPSVDTGMGLERTASVLQNVDSNYDIDLFQSIIQKISKIADKPYDRKSPEAASFRVIADHARSISFLIADGVLPSNEGRGYVLRRILRRAIRHGKKLGLNQPFLTEVCDAVIDEMKSAFSGLTSRRPLIRKLVLAEETQFLKTLEKGLALLDEEISHLKKGQKLPGETAFKLYDTYGFPVDLTRVIAKESQIEVDDQAFDRAMEVQKTKSRKAWKGSGEAQVDSIFFEIEDKLSDSPQTFIGYHSIHSLSQCQALVLFEGSKAQSIETFSGSLKKGQKLFAVIEKTPFYGESGGQIGDRGEISSEDNSFQAKVVDAQKPTGNTIFIEIEPTRKQGRISVGDEVTQNVDQRLRNLTMRNHTATHLLHWALRKTLGEHVKQAGSLVTPEVLRFDFTHFEGLSSKEIEAIEFMINSKIWSDDGVLKEEMTKAEAEKKGAIAFFGEKYGDRVRVVSVGDYSVELCGGTHVDRSSEIHLFKILSESSIASGVRRITAATSEAAFLYLSEKDKTAQALKSELKAGSDQDLVQKVHRLLDSERNLKKQIAKLEEKQANQLTQELVNQSQNLGRVSLITGMVPLDASGAKKLRQMAEAMINQNPSAVVVLGMQDLDKKKAHLLTAAGKKAQSHCNANELIKALAPLIQGRGGGKPDLAQAGGSDPKGIPKALDQAKSIVEEKSS